MEYEFTVNRCRVRITPDQVVVALHGVKPGRVQTHAVEIGGTWYPTKQAFAIAFGVERADFSTHHARGVFRRMGFRVSARSRPLPGRAAEGRPCLEPPPEMIEFMAAEEDLLEMPPILLEWSWWEWWDDLHQDDSTGEGVEVPRGPGVYEVRIHDEDQRLYIGRASDLQARVKYALVNGSGLHPAGRKLQENENTSRICVRWAETDRPAAAEEELHRQHVEQFGTLPKYTQRT